MTLFNVHPYDRVQVFIDGLNVHGSVRALSKKLDYRMFLNKMSTETRLIRSNYYTTVRDNHGDQFFSVLDFLEYTGYNIVTKEIHDHVDDNGHIRVRGTMIGEMTADMVLAADRTDHIILLSGDGELTAAVEACKKLDSRVTVVAYDKVLSEELRRACDAYVPLQNLPSDILLDPEQEFVR